MKRLEIIDKPKNREYSLLPVLLSIKKPLTFAGERIRIIYPSTYCVYINIPLDCIIPAVPGYSYDHIVIVSIWRAKQVHFHPGQFLDAVMDFHDFILAFLLRKASHMLVTFTVIARS